MNEVMDIKYLTNSFYIQAQERGVSFLAFVLVKVLQKNRTKIYSCNYGG